MRDGAAAEGLIVKTRQNAFGAPEGQLTHEEKLALGYVRFHRTPIDDLDEYPVMPRARIPAKWWNTRSIFLERFITNRRRECLREFFSGRHCVRCVIKNHALVKRPEHGRFSASYLLTRDRAQDPSGGKRLPGHVWTAFTNSVRFADSFGLGYGTLDLVFDNADV
jgi:hypothetical protein